MQTPPFITKAIWKTKPRPFSFYLINPHKKCPGPSQFLSIAPSRCLIKTSPRLCCPGTIPQILSAFHRKCNLSSINTSVIMLKEICDVFSGYSNTMFPVRVSGKHPNYESNKNASAEFRCEACCEVITTPFAFK